MQSRDIKILLDNGFIVEIYNEETYIRITKEEEGYVMLINSEDTYASLLKGIELDIALSVMHYYEVKVYK